MWSPALTSADVLLLKRGDISAPWAVTKYRIKSFAVTGDKVVCATSSNSLWLGSARAGARWRRIQSYYAESPVHSVAAAAAVGTHREEWEVGKLGRLAKAALALACALALVDARRLLTRSVGAPDGRRGGRGL